MKIAIVTWVDAAFYAGDHDITDNFPLIEIKTVGWLVSKDEEKVVIAQDLADDQVAGTTVIPRSLVKSIKVK